MNKRLFFLASIAMLSSACSNENEEILQSTNVQKEQKQTYEVSEYSSVSDFKNEASHFNDLVAKASSSRTSQTASSNVEGEFDLDEYLVPRANYRMAISKDLFVIVNDTIYSFTKEGTILAHKDNKQEVFEIAKGVKEISFDDFVPQFALDSYMKAGEKKERYSLVANEKEYDDIFIIDSYNFIDEELEQASNQRYINQDADQWHTMKKGVTWAGKFIQGTLGLGYNTKHYIDVPTGSGHSQRRLGIKIYEINYGIFATVGYELTGQRKNWWGWGTSNFDIQAEGQLLLEVQDMSNLDGFLQKVRQNTRQSKLVHLSDGKHARIYLNLDLSHYEVRNMKGPTVKYDIGEAFGAGLKYLGSMVDQNGNRTPINPYDVRIREMFKQQVYNGDIGLLVTDPRLKNKHYHASLLSFSGRTPKRVDFGDKGFSTMIVSNDPKNIRLAQVPMKYAGGWLKARGRYNSSWSKIIGMKTYE